MPYCSLEEAWGSDFKDASYYAKVNSSPSVPGSKSNDLETQPPNTIHSRVPPEMAKKGLEVVPAGEGMDNPSLDNYFPSYSGGVPSVKYTNQMKSNYVPYKVNFPERAKRNYTYPVETMKNDDDDDNDSAIDVLEDNDHDMRHIDIQRRVHPEYEPDNYMTSQDYFLYKKYMKLAEKYKQKLRKKYKNFIDEMPANKNVLENFGNYSSNFQYSGSYSVKDVFVLVIVGIFIIFALDIFVKLGGKMKK